MIGFTLLNFQIKFDLKYISGINGNGNVLGKYL